MMEVTRNTQATHQPSAVGVLVGHPRIGNVHQTAFQGSQRLGLRLRPPVHVVEVDI